MRRFALALLCVAAAPWSVGCGKVREDGAPSADAGFEGSALDASSSDGLVAPDASGMVVLFGGTPSKAPKALDDTWTFDGTAWTEIPVNSSPSARTSAAMARLGNDVVLFGGEGPSYTVLGDTWTFDGTSWTEVSLENAPPARSDAAIATLGNEIVLFGGQATQGLNDTWTFDGTNWTEVSVANPPPARSNAAMATLGNKIVLFGGDAWTDAGTSGFINDTWTFDGTSWTELSMANAPPARGGAAMATLGNAVVLFGGEGEGSSTTSGLLLDTWTFDGTSWTEVSGNSTPTGPGGIMATLGNELVLFAEGYTVWDTSVFDGASWSKLNLRPDLSPPPRVAASMASLP
jgi:N-acetylneuraminic acid mutarotase